MTRALIIIIILKKMDAQHDLSEHLTSFKPVIAVEVKHLTIEVAIQPEISHIRVTGKITMTDIEDEVKFLLNPCLEINEIHLISNNERIPVEKVETRPEQDIFIPSTCYEIKIPEEFQGEQEYEFEVDYEGKIYRYSFQTSRIRSDYVELAIYAIWYPMVSFADRPTFSITLQTPKDWIWIMNTSRVSEDPLSWEAGTPRTDLTLHGRPKSNAIRNEDSTLFWGEPRNLELLKPLEKDFYEYQELMKSWFGEASSESLKIILVPRDFGGGYARNGLIVMQDDVSEEYIRDKKDNLLRFWAHELAHSWFCKATVEDYHNWIDEACAEYTSYLASEEILGQEWFSAILDRARKRLKEHDGLSSIKSILRSHPHAQILYYLYGALILHEIREKIGRDTFIQVLERYAQTCLKKTRTTTEDFVKALEDVTEYKLGGLLDKRLSNPPTEEILEPS
ncbi:MAG: hypothetical protein BAJATHORv1_10636 [Candidatus Thorarchaeota archaeon]|nr:MAG: hypothetical protein BAJATHORv1_10636 [Candidatus Thorarchaeota archaeon]